MWERHFPDDAAFGAVRRALPMHAWGRAQDIGTTIADVIERSAILQPPTAAQKHVLKSDSLEDAPNKTGMQKCAVFGLRSWNEPESYEVVDLNGQTDIDTKESYVFINYIGKMRGEGPGSFVGSAGHNVGLVTCQAKVDGTESARILPTVNGSQMAVYAFPKGQRLYLTNYYASMNRKGSGSRNTDIIPVINGEPDRVLGGFADFIPIGLSSNGSTFAQNQFNPYPLVYGPMIIKMQAISDVNGIDVSAGFQGYLTRFREDE